MEKVYTNRATVGTNHYGDLTKLGLNDFNNRTPRAKSFVSDCCKLGAKESSAGRFVFGVKMSIPFTWVYLIHDPYTDLFKIGKSDRPDERHKQLCNPKSYGTIPAAPTDYELIEAWLVHESSEGQLHELFAACRVRGEWFNLTAYFELPHSGEAWEVAYRLSEIFPYAKRYKSEDRAAQEELEYTRYRLEYEQHKNSMLQASVNHAQLMGYQPLALPPASVTENVH